MHKNNYEQLNFAYLPRTAKFYGVRFDDATKRINKGLKNGKYDEWLFKKPPKPTEKDFEWCNPRKVELYILLEMQGVFGIPELIGFGNLERYSDVYNFYYEKKSYSKDPPKHLKVTDMALQLFKALEIVHQNGAVVRSLKPSAIQWHNEEIKIASLDLCKFHADIDAGWGWHKDGQEQQPTYDMLCAGRVIKEWIERYGSEDKELAKLVDVLTNPEPAMRLSASNAIKALQTGVYDVPQVPRTFDYEALLDCYGEWTLSKKTDQHSYELLQQLEERELSDVIKRSSGVKWNRPTAGLKRHKDKIIIPRVLLGKFEGQKVCGKIITGYPLVKPEEIKWRNNPYDMTVLIPHEFYVLQMMSGKKHFPTLLSFEMFRCKECTGVVMTMPRYHSKPKNKNVIKTAIELLTALKTLHSHGLIHGDIAPSNVMWDDDDSLILIDYDCVQFVKKARSNDPYFCIGQKGFVSSDSLKTFFADVFSAGKVLEYYSEKWRQQETMSLIDEMTKEHWFKRLSVDEALTKWMTVETL